MTDCCSTPNLLPLDDAIKKLKAQISPVTGTIKVQVEESLGCILAADMYSPLNVPPHNNSSIDGYALRLADIKAENTLPLAGDSFAGHPYQGTPPTHHCIRIMTGACIPEGTDTVIMQEHTEKTTNGIAFKKLPEKAGSNIRLAGEDIQEGACVFHQGHKIKAQDIGLLASLGVPEITVSRPLKVSIFSTGDELKLPGESLALGEIYDSNRFMIKAMMRKMNIDVIDLGCLPDNREIIREAFKLADEQADAVISSGGASVGETDYTKEILDEQGTTSFWKLAIKPGKPFAFGKLPDSYFFGLPGNPVSALVTFQQLVAPALRFMMSDHSLSARELAATLTSPLKKSPGRKEFQRGILTTKDGYVEVASTGSQSSGILRSMSMADCYIVLPEDQGSVAAGEKVTVQLFDDLLL